MLIFLNYNNQTDHWTSCHVFHKRTLWTMVHGDSWENKAEKTRKLAFLAEFSSFPISVV